MRRQAWQVILHDILYIALGLQGMRSARERVPEYTSLQRTKEGKKITTIYGKTTLLSKAYSRKYTT